MSKKTKAKQVNVPTPKKTRCVLFHCLCGYINVVDACQGEMGTCNRCGKVHYLFTAGTKAAQQLQILQTLYGKAETGKSNPDQLGNVIVWLNTKDREEVPVIADTAFTCPQCGHEEVVHVTEECVYKAPCGCCYFVFSADSGEEADLIAYLAFLVQEKVGVRTSGCYENGVGRFAWVKPGGHKQAA